MLVFGPESFVPLLVSSDQVAMLFLGSVALRLLRDLDSTCGGHLEVILRYRPSSSSERILSAPIHSPLSGRHFGPSSLA